MSTANVVVHSDASSLAGSSYWQPSLTDNTIARTFHPFNALQEELQLQILSFIAEAPLETTMERGGRDMADGSVATLTHILPYVCKAFHRFCQNDALWEMAIRRAIQKDPVWAAVISPEWDLSSNTPTTNTSIPTIPAGAAARSNSAPLYHYQNLYRTTLREKIYFQGPVFIMSMNWRIDEPTPYELHFFEPRYVFMIRSLLREYHTWMTNHPQGEQQVEAGGDRAASSSLSQSGVSPPPMCFLHMHQGRQAPALLVQMVECLGLPTGTFAVRLMPRALVQINSLWVEDNTGNLHYAQGRRVTIIRDVEDNDDDNSNGPLPVHDDSGDDIDEEEDDDDDDDDDEPRGREDEPM